MDITFNETPSNWRVPGNWTEIRPFYGRLGITEWPAKVLLVGQMTTGAPGVAGVPFRFTREEEVAARAGTGSIAHLQARAFLKNNRTTEVWMVLQADPAGAKASATITLSGSPTAAGALALNIAGRRVSIPVSAGATVTALGAALVAAINANTLVPVTAAAVAGVVTVTARNAGVLGLGIDLRPNPLPGDVVPAGLTSTISAVAGGTGVADVAPVLTAIAAIWFTDFAFAQNDAASLALIEAELAARYRASGRMDGHAYVGWRGTHGELTALGAARNSPFVSPIGAKAAGSPTWAWGAALCGKGAFHLTEDPARQLKSIVLEDIVGPAPADQFNLAEQQLLLLDGNSTFSVTSDGKVVLERVITTYQKSDLGADDEAWLDIMVPKVASRVRYDWNTFKTLNYPRHKLADDDSPAATFSDSVVTPRQMHGSWAGRCRRYEERGWIEDVRRTVAETVFQRTPDDKNRLEERLRFRAIGNLIVDVSVLEFEA